jgi:hypothetical protein
MNARMGRTVMAIAMALAATSTGAGARAGAALPDPSPTLTAAQLDALSKVAGWDFDYSLTMTVTQTSAGAGDYISFTGTEYTSWSTLATSTETMHVSGTVSGPQGCMYEVIPGKTPSWLLPCTVDYAQPGRVSFDVNKDTTNHFAEARGCGPGGADPLPDGLSSATVVGSGSYRPDGTPGHAAYPGFAIDTASNPPRALAVLGFDSVPAALTETSGGCATSSTTTSDITYGKGAAFSFGDPAVFGGNGDTQVRVDTTGDFVVRGTSRGTLSMPTCILPASPAFGFNPCASTTGSLDETTDATWTLRAHGDCPKITPDKLTQSFTDRLTDSDGDSIPDCWETDNNIAITEPDGTTVDVPLPGADPQHKDLYVEADSMPGREPVAGALSDAVAAFAAAPVPNPDGRRGVTLHATPDETLERVTTPLAFDPPAHVAGDFWTIKDVQATPGAHCPGHFGTVAQRGAGHCADILAARKLVTRYAIFADAQAGTSSSGRAEYAPTTRVGGNDFVVTLGGTWGPDEWSAMTGGQRGAQAATFMHELGHTLGLGHGGGDSVNCKPNYFSIMNYDYQFAQSDPSRPLDYSRLAQSGLNEAALTESAGLAGVPGWQLLVGRGGFPVVKDAGATVDWNGNGLIDPSDVSEPISRIDTTGGCDLDPGVYPASVDGRYVRVIFTRALDAGQIPSGRAFTIRVGGTAAALDSARPVRISQGWLYVKLAQPVVPGAVVTIAYKRPATGPVLTDDADGHAFGPFASSLVNVSDHRKSLAGYNDWAHIQYSVRDTPFFAGGSSPVPPQPPELTATDVIATSEASATVPGAPTHVRATSNGAHATISWAASVNNGSPVSAYEVSTAPGGRTVTVSGAQTHATIAPLDAGRYTFKVRARNAIGASPWSASSNPVSIVRRSGYWMLGADGRVYPFGDAQPLGNASGPAVAIATRADGSGYWITDAAGNVDGFGTAHPHGGHPALQAGELVSAIAATPSGNGYWLFTNRGHARAYGDAHFYGDMTGTDLNGRVVASVATPSGHGYYMVGSDGGVFSFGDARFHGSTGDLRLNEPIVGIAPDPSNRGYWLVASDGGVFAFNAPFRGSMGATSLAKPVNGLVAYGNGYLMVASDGGIFDFSDKPFVGSLGSHPPRAPIIGIATFATT